MKNFFDRLAGDDDKKKKNNNFNFKLPGQKFKGQGQSLGGTTPGKVIRIELADPGPLGMKIEKRPVVGTSVVAMVVPNSQAQAAGIQRGDVICRQGSNGQDEIEYKAFLEMAASTHRPLVFEIRRIKTKTTTVSAHSADALTKKQAMIYAAEQREKANKQKTIVWKTKTSLLTEDEKQKRQEELDKIDLNPKSEETVKAVRAAKADEAALAAQLGYNPYETAKANAGQARTATVATKHGAIKNEENSIPTVKAPPELPRANDEPISHEFEDVYATVISTNAHEAVTASFPILRKLITNAVTKGQQKQDEDAASKFRRVRLSNPKIHAAIVEVNGALELMMSVGFQLSAEEGDEECYLVFPYGSKGPGWLKPALDRMELYEKSEPETLL